MDNTRKINTTITTRYDKDHQDIFKSVLKLVEENAISKSKAQLLLVERGLVHTNNPEPLIKEIEKKVYVDRPVEKKVYVEKPVYVPAPKDEHIDTPKPSDKPQATQATQQETPTSTNSGWLWLLGGLVTGVGVLVGWKYLAHKNGNNGAPLADSYGQFYQQFGVSTKHKNSIAIAPR